MCQLMICSVAGCLYVLPKEYDGYYDEDGTFEHMRCATKADNSN